VTKLSSSNIMSRFPNEGLAALYRLYPSYLNFVVHVLSFI